MRRKLMRRANAIRAAASLRLHYGGFSDATAPLPLLQLA